MSLSEKYEWMDWASCREVGVEIFVSDDYHSSRKAKRICQDCPVITECLEWAMDKPDLGGVLGGLTERERQRIRNLKIRAVS